MALAGEDCKPKLSKPICGKANHFWVFVSLQKGRWVALFHSPLTMMFVVAWSEKSIWLTWTATVDSGLAVNTILNTMPSRMKISNLGGIDGRFLVCGTCQNDGLAQSGRISEGPLG